MPNPTTPADAIAGRLLGNYPNGAQSVTDAADLAALVDARINPSKPTLNPDGDNVTFAFAGGGDGQRLDGASGLKPREFRVEAVSTTSAGAEAIMDAVSALLAGWRDRDRGVQGCFAVGDRDEDTLDTGQQVAGQTFQLWFKAQ